RRPRAGRASGQRSSGVSTKPAFAGFWRRDERPWAGIPRPAELVDQIDQPGEPRPARATKEAVALARGEGGGLRPDGASHGDAARARLTGDPDLFLVSGTAAT